MAVPVGELAEILVGHVDIRIAARADADDGGGDGQGVEIILPRSLYHFLRDRQARLRGRLPGRGRYDLQSVPPSRRCSMHPRSEEHTSELQSLMRISYAVFCLKKKKTEQITVIHTTCI